MKKGKSKPITWTESAARIASYFTSIEGRSLKVHALGGTVTIDLLPEDDTDIMRLRIGKLLAGTPAGLDDTRAILELCL